MQKHTIRLKDGDVSRLAVKRINKGMFIEVYDANDDEVLIQAMLNGEELDNLIKALGYVKFTNSLEE
ncbi:MAG: hypothetical protein WC455_10535 [Dehalococcoidia bacterium]|jgi:hypothetical protein